MGFNHDAGTYVHCSDRVDLTVVKRVREGQSLTVKQFQRLLGLIAAASKVIYIYIWPAVHETHTVVAQEQGVLLEGKPTPHTRLQGDAYVP